MCAEPLAKDRLTPEVSERYYGKHRGVVVNNIDPLGLSRLLVLVPSLPQALQTWALPCVPYAGTLEGMHYIPPIGANVWVEFEGGDPSYPIWTGCYWEDGELGQRRTINPAVPALAKLLKTLSNEFLLNDTPGVGGVKLETQPPAVPIPVTMTFDAQGVTLTCGPCSLTMNPAQGITLKMGATMISLTAQGISMSAPTISVTAQQNAAISAGAQATVTGASKAGVSSAGAVEVKAGGTANVEAGGSMAIKSGAAASVQAGAALDLKGGAVVSIKGPLVNIN